MELSESVLRGARASVPVVREAALVTGFFGGLGLVCYGVWLVYEPAAFVLSGLMIAGLIALYVRGS